MFFAHTASILWKSVLASSCMHVCTAVSPNILLVIFFSHCTSFGRLHLVTRHAPGARYNEPWLSYLFPRYGIRSNGTCSSHLSSVLATRRDVVQHNLTSKVVYPPLSFLSSFVVVNTFCRTFFVLLLWKFEFSQPPHSVIPIWNQLPASILPHPFHPKNIRKFKTAAYHHLLRTNWHWATIAYVIKRVQCPTLLGHHLSSQSLLLN